MDSSSPVEEEKKKIYEVITFPVPFVLQENKENIFITSHAFSKPSQEKIINQAFKFHSQGNISDAAKYYQLLITQGLEDHRVYCNFGVILKNVGKFKEAEKSIRKAIEINPDFAEAYYNLGNILNDLGKLEEAEFLYQKAIELNPNLADAYYNLGNILKDLGKLKEAEFAYSKVIEIKADYAEAHANLGGVLKDLGNLQGAFDSYLKALDYNPRYSNVYALITRFLKESDPSQLNKSKLKRILNVLLEKNDVPHQELSRAFNYLFSNKIISNLRKSDLTFSELELIIKDEIIINALKKIIFCDLKLESLLTKVRRDICCRIAKNTETISCSELQFTIALGEQCFFNEHIYSFTEEENISVNTIIQRCKGGEINEASIAILSCYFPLYKLFDLIASIQSFNSNDQNFKQLVRLQISQPLEEIELSKNIKKLGSINDDISLKVKSQYEENPYPRWVGGIHSVKQNISIAQIINNEIRPNHISYNEINNELKVLYAGCGTGKQIVNKQIYKNAQITGIDLSLSSLSYAKRKINEFGINNVELLQLDILDVYLLEENFDIITCSGVLHHMEDPLKGLKALLGVLKNNGFLQLGLYSELARQDVIEARNYISNKSLQTNENSIRDFRERVISGELRNLKSLTKFQDFYSLSELRDLCFNTQEHRFNIHQIQEILKSNKLQFLGFVLQQPIKSLYKQYFPEDKKQTNLQNWAKFEERHPNTFKEMYQFWVSKRTD